MTVLNTDKDLSVSVWVRDPHTDPPFIERDWLHTKGGVKGYPPEGPDRHGGRDGAVRVQANIVAEVGRG